MVVARQVHHSPFLQILNVVKFVPIHPLESFGQKFLDPVTAMTNCETLISTSTRSNQHLPSEGVDGDDEPEVLLQHLVDGVGGHETAVHAQGKGLHEEMGVGQVGANLSHLDIDKIISFKLTEIYILDT